MEEEKNTATDCTPDTTSQIVEALRTIGCQPEVQPDGKVNFMYQNAHLEARISGRCVRILEPGWARFSINDPTLPKLRKAINEINYEYGAKVVMTVPDPENRFYLHSLTDFILHRDLPDKTGYIHWLIRNCVDTKANVRSRYWQLTDQQSPQQSDNTQTNAQ